MSNYTEHIAGPLRAGVQRCKRCGIALSHFDTMGRWPVGRSVFQDGLSYVATPAQNVTINECGKPSEVDKTSAAQTPKNDGGEPIDPVTHGCAVCLACLQLLSAAYPVPVYVHRYTEPVCPGFRFGDINGAHPGFPDAKECPQCHGNPVAPDDVPDLDGVPVAPFCQEPEPGLCGYPLCDCQPGRK